MAKRGRRSSKGYKQAIIEAVRDGSLQPLAGQVIEVKVIHQDECPFLRGGECNCNPDVLQQPDRQVSEKNGDQ